MLIGAELDVFFIFIKGRGNTRKSQIKINKIRAKAI